jgi:hypothetical protein
VRKNDNGWCRLSLFGVSDVEDEGKRNVFHTFVFWLFFPNIFNHVVCMLACPFACILSWINYLLRCFSLFLKISLQKFGDNIECNKGSY